MNRVCFCLHVKFLIMQKVMFNSKYIPVSKDTSHSHVILKGGPLEAESSRLSSPKDLRNEITQQWIAVYLLDPLI